MHFFYFFLGCVQIVVPSVSFQRSLASQVLVILMFLSLFLHVSTLASGLTEAITHSLSVTSHTVTSLGCSVSVSVFQTVSCTSCTQHNLAIKCPFCLRLVYLYSLSFDTGFSFIFH